MTQGELPSFLWEVTRQLRRRHVAIGIEDYEALRRALAAGFGLSSDDELRRLCVMLWAKSPEEAEIVRAAFTRSDMAEWALSRADEPDVDDEASLSAAPDDPLSVQAGAGQAAHADGGRAPQARPVADLAGSPPSTGEADRTLVLVAQYPVTDREVAQALRRLRRPLRTGPAVEIDVAATIERRSRHGVATPPVLVPRRRNTAKLLLLIDRYGSMTPFHGYVDYVVGAIRNAGRIDDVREVYFHDVPGNADSSVLADVADPLRPDIDLILPLVAPLGDGWVYDDRELTVPRPLPAVLDELDEDTATIVISDAGAARKRLDTVRLLDMVALLKALRARGSPVTWLNPARPASWPPSTAGQLARYIPMYPLTTEGLNQTVDVLRGHPAEVARPL
jgi:uncharacterized protein with von Willebrand factor type A (vWA) domain